MQVKALSKLIKPSNFKNFLNNKIKKAKLISEIEFFLDKNGEVENYIIRGEVVDLRVDLFKDIILSKVNLSFLLIKKIF